MTVFFMLLSGAAAQQAESRTDAGKPVRGFQLSLLPYIGTDGSEAPHHTYRISFNVLGGITGGIDGLEAGGFASITRGNVKGIQVSGFGNLVSGNLNGFQGAGFINVTGGQVQAFRGSGFLNITGGDFEGFTGAGFANITGGNGKGFSGAGFANITGGGYQGFAGAGFANITGGSANAFMGAGFANVTGGNFTGIQAAGFGNFTGGNVTGPQIAGFMNTAADLKGLQVAGFLNIAGEVEGMQVGFINIADTITGIPVGFLSIVRKGGLRQLEIAGSDVLHVGASFRIGVPHFYNIFSFGIRPFDKDGAGGFGYGIGTGIPVSGKLVLNLEAHSTQLRNDWSWKARKLDMLNEGRLLLSTRAGQSLQVFAGPVLYNQTYRDCTDCGYTPVDIAPDRVFSTHNYAKHTSIWWIGARAGLRMDI